MSLSLASQPSESALERFTFKGSVNETKVLDALGLSKTLSITEHIQTLADNIAGLTEEVQKVSFAVGDAMAGNRHRHPDERRLNNKKLADTKLRQILETLNSGNFQISKPQSETVQIPAGNGLFVGHPIKFCEIQVDGLTDPVQLPAACFVFDETAA